MSHIGIPGHGKKFQRRLRRVASRADQLGDCRIAQSVREECDAYAKSFAHGGPAPWRGELECTLESIAEGRPDLVAQGIKSWGAVKHILKKQFGSRLSPSYIRHAKRSWTKELQSYEAMK
jgi:hypothetical protein